MKRLMEKTREKLNRLVEKGNTPLYSGDILEASQELDELISIYMERLEKDGNLQHCKNKTQRNKGM